MYSVDWEISSDVANGVWADMLDFCPSFDINEDDAQFYNPPVLNTIGSLETLIIEELMELE